MSRIGKQPVKIVNNVEIKLNGQKLTVKGPKGELNLDINSEMKVIIEENQIIITRPSDSKEHRSLHGLTRSLIANMVEGVTKGFEKKIEILGVGYKAQVQGNKLILNLGFSHPVNYDIPDGITIEQDKTKKNIFTISGIDKQQVGQATAVIRAFKKPEPYKGKGIRYLGEYVRRKAGKSAASA